MEEQLAACCVVEHEVQLLFCLEGIVQTHDERVVDRAEHSSLGAGVFDLLPLDDVCLVQHLHRIQLLVGLLPHQCHLRIERYKVIDVMYNSKKEHFRLNK